MHDSVPSARYSRVCNVLHLWRIWLIPTYSLPTLGIVFCMHGYCTVQYLTICRVVTCLLQTECFLGNKSSVIES